MSNHVSEFFNVINHRFSNIFVTNDDTIVFVSEQSKLNIHCTVAKNSEYALLITVDDEINNKAYRWIASEYKNEYYKVLDEIGLDHKLYTDDILYEDIEDYNEMNNIIKDIISKDIISFELPIEDYEAIIDAAKKMNMTIDEFCEYAVRKKLDEDHVQ